MAHTRQEDTINLENSNNPLPMRSMRPRWPNLPYFLHAAAIFVALSTWVFGFLGATLWWMLTLGMISTRPILAAINAVAIAILLVTPLEIRPPAFAQRFIAFSLQAAADYFPVTFHWEDREAFNEKNAPYIIAFEPHSVLPHGISFVSKYAPPATALPPALQDVRILTSSAGFWAVGMRHLWWWLGCRPVSKTVMHKLLVSVVDISSYLAKQSSVCT
jgi:Diacylglycerol acyltransferase